ncbi:MAG: hypothetical protein WDN46_09315 [Methylocella sp.]
MAYEIKREDQTAIEPGDLSDAEAALIRLLRRRRAGYHQLTISWFGLHWCVEANDLRVNAPRGVGYGDSFEEAWSAVPTRLDRPERHASDRGTERPRRFA